MLVTKYLFFQRTERKLCSEAQLFHGLEKLYGSLDSEELAERLASKSLCCQFLFLLPLFSLLSSNWRLDKLGLPEDKYDAAAITVAVMHHAASEEEKFVDRFMWAMNDHGHIWAHCLGRHDLFLLPGNILIRINKILSAKSNISKSSTISPFPNR